MAGDKFLFRSETSGKVEEQRATDVSTGVAEAGDIIALGPDGKIDPTLLPTTVGPDVVALEAAEALGVGSYVNIFDDAGTVKVRLADNSNGRAADGFVKEAAALGAQAMVYSTGDNDALSGLTGGLRYYLDTAGGVTTTPPVAPAATISQLLGKSISATAISSDIEDCIGLIA